MQSSDCRGYFLGYCTGCTKNPNFYMGHIDDDLEAMIKIIREFKSILSRHDDTLMNIEESDLIPPIAPIWKKSLEERLSLLQGELNSLGSVIGDLDIQVARTCR